MLQASVSFVTIKRWR